MERLLVINPGSTSTKLAIYDGETEHRLRRSTILLKSWLNSRYCGSTALPPAGAPQQLAEIEVSLESITAIVCREDC